MTNPTPRELTADEIRARFLEHVRGIVDFWSRTSGSEMSKLEGVAFSMLVIFDGESAALPSFAVIPTPHPDNKEYRESEGRNWFPPFEVPDGACDIAGSLHEEFAGMMVS